jgi:branched-chain amino acid transport system permease protein
VIGPYLEDVLVQLGINVILALSLYFPLSAGQLSLGQGGFMAIGAYLASWLTATLGWPWPLAFAAAAAAAGLVGALVGLPALRVRGIYLVLLTMAFGEIVRVFFLNFGPTGAAQGFRGMPFVTTLPLVAVLAVAVAILAARTAASRMGARVRRHQPRRAGRRDHGHRRDAGQAGLVHRRGGGGRAGRRAVGALRAIHRAEEFGFARSVMPFTVRGGGRAADLLGIAGGGRRVDLTAGVAPVPEGVAARAVWSGDARP